MLKITLEYLVKEEGRGGHFILPEKLVFGNKHNKLDNLISAHTCDKSYAFIKSRSKVGVGVNKAINIHGNLSLSRLFIDEIQF